MIERFAFTEAFPSALLERYVPLELLSENDLGQTFLLQQKGGGHFAVARLCEPESAKAEAEILSRLSHKGIPKLLDEIEADGRTYLIREYMPGVPLSEYAIKPLPEAQVVNIALSLCELLGYIHSQTPPVIHRDLKPSNILIDPATGHVSLIDFGIARSFSPDAPGDTVLAGTRRFAPPEQYGFGQTDARADIYALGIVLCWLLSGQTSVEKLRIPSRRLARVIRRCAAFSPKDRYRSALAVRWALLNVDGRLQKRLWRAGGFMLALLAALTAGFAIGRFTDVRPAVFYNSAEVVFSEPLVEQAVRLQLGKTDGQPVLKEDLDQVAELYIYCDQIVTAQDAFYTMRTAVDSGQIEAKDGTISTLNDIAQLKNLHVLCLGYQQVTDISALSSLSNLQSLQLYNLPITSIEVVHSMPHLANFVMDRCDGVTDISPLSACPNLSQLVMTDCRAEDFSVLAELGDIGFLHLQCVDPSRFLPYLQGKTVRQLKMGSEPLNSFELLSGIEGLEDLILGDMLLPSLDGIEAISSLKFLTLTEMPRLGLEPLLSLPYLETLTLSEDMRQAGEAIENEADFSINYQ